MDINNEILALYNDCIYQELNEYYGKTTIFNILGIERNENRHSSFLKWMLDNRSSHGLGDIPMRKFLRLYAASLMKDDEDRDLKVLLMSGDYRIDISEMKTEQPITKASNDSQGRIDIWGRMVLYNLDKDIERKIVLIIENKIYSVEGENQTSDYHKYFENNHEDDEVAIEIFLTPKAPKGSESKKSPVDNHFKHLVYPDLLKYVILPISKIPMPQEASLIISDYIRNLGQPSTSSENGNEYSIIATSEDEKNKLDQFYEDHKDLFTLAFIAGNKPQLIKTIGKVDNFRAVIEYITDREMFEQCNDTKKLSWKECCGLLEEVLGSDLLEAFWTANEKLFKSVLYNRIGKGLDICVNPEDFFRKSNRDTSRYDVSAKGISYGHRLFKNRAALALFNAYVKLHPEMSLDDMRKEFPCEEINMYYPKKYYKYMFYNIEEKEEITFDVENSSLKGKRGGVETWDFFVNDKDLIKLKDCKAMVVKMWRKTDFDRLVDLMGKKCKDIKITPSE